MPKLRMEPSRILMLAAAGLAFAFIAVAISDPSPPLLAIIVLALTVALVTFYFREWSRIQRWYRQLPSPMRGALAGCLVWCFCFVWAFSFRTFQLDLPFPLHFITSLMKMLASLIAFPIGVGGWLFLWGDDGGPRILESVTLNVLGGILLNAAVGAVLFYVVQRFRRKHALPHLTRPKPDVG